MSDPDIDYTVPLTYFETQIRVELGKTMGDVDWFLIQLEYNPVTDPLAYPDWKQVARFDHHPRKSVGHDIRMEGLHLDTYKQGINRKVNVIRGFPQVAVNNAPAFCEDFLKDNEQRLVAQFKGSI